MSNSLKIFNFSIDSSQILNYNEVRIEERTRRKDMKQLKDFRILLGKSIEEMASDLKVGSSMYEKIEYGYREPSKNFIKKFKKRYPMLDTNIFFTK